MKFEFRNKLLFKQIDRIAMKMLPGISIYFQIWRRSTICQNKNSNSININFILKTVLSSNLFFNVQFFRISRKFALLTDSKCWGYIFGIGILSKRIPLVQIFTFQGCCCKICRLEKEIIAEKFVRRNIQNIFIFLMVDGFREIWNVRKTIFYKRKYLETLNNFLL